ncbi:hypothetical protein AGMMS50239_32010 [Bacteroidia bacterium]|nr:hypothetical protein AGMMS50239_32010 [Bacteroidia bacterium]
MTKKILFALGALAFLVAMTLNLNHAANDYGLKTNSLWTTVAASTTSTGTGTGGGGSICVEIDCIGNKAIETYWWYCFTATDGHTYCYYVAGDTGYEEFLGKKYECSYNQPNNWSGYNPCEECNPFCREEVSTSN